MSHRDKSLSYSIIRKVIGNIFGKSQHKKRLDSMANAALGIINSGSLIVNRIGGGLSDELNLVDKHATKQVDRLLSNEKLNVKDASEYLVPFIIGGRKKIKVTIDWTDFYNDNHATLCLNLATSHGRATPLLTKTVKRNTLKNNRNRYEDELLQQLRALIPEDVDVTILADRGFCDIRLMAFIKYELGFNYIIRVRGNITVTDTMGETRTSKKWVGKNGRAKTLRNAEITYEGFEVGTIVCTQAKAMKEPWCIVCSEETISGSALIKWYAKRWGCEPQFRDTKDIHFGMGLSSTHIKTTERRDRLLFISAIATVLSVLLGAAGEIIGLDRYLKTNTVKRRTLSLFRQGLRYFKKIQKMFKDTFNDLLNKFHELISKNKSLEEILGYI